MLKSISYIENEGKDAAIQVARYLGLQAKPFDTHSRKPVELLIGPNWFHDASTFVRSNGVPLVVFDKHTDMYCTSGPPEIQDSANWIYFQLQKGREVHLALTSISYAYKSSSRLPKGSNLTVYSPRGASEVKFNLDAQSGCLEKRMIGKKVKPISELSKLKPVRKQISFDEDFLNEKWGASELEALLAPIVSKGDTIDFWIEGMYYTSPKTIAEGLKAACSIL